MIFDCHVSTFRSSVPCMKNPPILTSMAYFQLTKTSNYGSFSHMLLYQTFPCYSQLQTLGFSRKSCFSHDISAMRFPKAKKRGPFKKNTRHRWTRGARRPHRCGAVGNPPNKNVRDKNYDHHDTMIAVPPSYKLVFTPSCKYRYITFKPEWNWSYLHQLSYLGGTTLYESSIFYHDRSDH